MCEEAPPVVTVTRTASFSAAHRLHSARLSEEENRRLYGKCNNPNGHGHNYIVEASVRGTVDSSTGMVLNIATLKVALASVIVQLDHKHIDLDVPYFRDGQIVSTTENVTVFVWRELASALGPASHLLHSVTIRETDNNVFTYQG